MKKSFLNKLDKVNFNKMVELNVKHKQGKIKQIAFTEEETRDIKKAMLKAEYIEANTVQASEIEKNTIKISTDKHLTTLKKFDDGMVLCIVSKNAHVLIERGEVEYYIKW